MEITTILFLIGRILFGGFFIMNGLNHFKNRQALVAYANSKGVASSNLAVLVTGLMILLGGLGILLGVYTQVALWLIILFLVPTSLIMHRFWKETDPMAKMSENTNFMKNMALAGAALMLLLLAEPWAMSLAI